MTLAPRYAMPMIARPLAAGLLLAAFWMATMPAQAGDGHDHGEAPAAAAGPSLPRFSAASELFELVGVLNGKQLTLYLDHASSNAPVKDAKLELELGGRKLSPKTHGEGEFELTLDEAPKTGVSPVTVTVSTASETDLLAGEIDVHAAAHAHAEPAGRRNTLVVGAVAVLLLALAAAWGLRRSRAMRAQPMGGAA